MCARLSLTRGESPGSAATPSMASARCSRRNSWIGSRAFRFPEYLLEKEDGQYVLTFHGPWIETTMWEIPALAILNELRSRGVLKDMGKFELQVLYARAMTRVWEKINHLKTLPDLSISDFGTRRRHGFLWQDWCVQAMLEGLGPSFLGTSNCLIALRREVEAVGTNAHELPMVYTALANGSRLLRAPYRVLEDWQEDYQGNLRVILPDTYGTSNFLATPRTGSQLDRHPHRFEGPDRGRRGGHRLVARPRPGSQGQARHLLGWSRRGHDRARAPAFQRARAHRLRLGHAADQRFPRARARWAGSTRLSIVCKVISADGHPTVKLSDNPTKAMGPPAEIERYKRVFQLGSQRAQPVLV